MRRRSGQSSALIFKVNQLGDSVVFLPVVEHLVRSGRFDPLCLWTTPLAEPLYQRLRPALNLEIVSRGNFYPAWKHPAKLWNLLVRVRSIRPASALVAEDMGNTAFLLALLSARRRVGHRPPYLKIPFALTDEVRLDSAAPAAEKAWSLGQAFSRAAGETTPWPQHPPPPDLTHLSGRDAEAFDILIHPGASRDYQRWPSDRFLELAERLSKDHCVGWIQTPEIPRRPRGSVRILPQGDLSHLVSHLARSSLFIANNSGPMHLASALGTPSVVLLGPSSRCWDPYWYPERFRLLRHESLPCIACDPPGLPPMDVCTNRTHPMACMNFWTVDMVEAEVRSWLTKWANPPRHL